MVAVRTVYFTLRTLSMDGIKTERMKQILRGSLDLLPPVIRRHPDIKYFQKEEVSKMEWKTVDESINCIRPYNLEKIKIIQNIDNVFKNNYIYLI